MANRSFYVNSPEPGDPAFSTEFFGDMYVISERERGLNGSASITKGNEILGGLSEAQLTNGTTLPILLIQ